MKRFLSKGLIVLILILCSARLSLAGIKMETDDGMWTDIGIRMQSWYQYVENGKGGGAEDLNDFMLRRIYFYVKGQINPHLGFFTHIAADRIGQDGLDSPGFGLGSGIAFRGGWLSLDFVDEFKIYAGRMYVPFTRSYGTTSTFTLLTLDLPFTQGGVRGGIFYPGKVGRDDGVTFWGNPFDGLIQYRAGIYEGVEDDKNPEDNLRFTGRIALNLLDKEKGWFNKGTYLGKKNILSIGAGIDSQNGLTLNSIPDENYLAWTVDLFLDHSIGLGAITLETAYIDIKEAPVSLASFSKLNTGDDANIFYVQTGYLISRKIGTGNMQPYFRYEQLLVDNKSDTNFLGFGINYYLKGHNAKLSLDYTLIDQEEETSGQKDQDIITFQITLGY